MAIRHIEGVIALAKTDLVLLPPAVAASRACIEAAAKGAWLVDRDDQFDREGRWLIHLASEERYLDRIAKRLGERGREVSALRQRRSEIAAFRLAVSEKLPSGVKLLPGTPSFERILEDLGGMNIYEIYIAASQSTHGEHAGTWLYRDGGLGTMKQVGEFIKASDWTLPLLLSLLALSHPARVFLSRIGGDPEEFLDKALEERLRNKIQEIGTNR